MLFATQMRSFWTTKLQTNESVRRATNFSGVSLFLFGSALRQSEPQDIDLLIVYDKTRVDIALARSMRIGLSHAVAADFGLAADVCLLTKEEASESDFIQAERCEMLWSVEQ